MPTTVSCCSFMLLFVKAFQHILSNKNQTLREKSNGVLYAFMQKRWKLRCFIVYFRIVFLVQLQSFDFASFFHDIAPKNVHGVKGIQIVLTRFKRFASLIVSLNEKSSEYNNVVQIFIESLARLILKLHRFCCSVLGLKPSKVVEGTQREVESSCIQSWMD
jgi:hypothetical protein